MVNIDFVQQQRHIREKLLFLLVNFDITKIERLLKEKESLLNLLETLQKKIDGSQEELIIKKHAILVRVFFECLQWADKEINAKKSEKHLKAAKILLKELDQEIYYTHNWLPEEWKSFTDAVNNLQEISDVRACVDAYGQLMIPTLYHPPLTSESIPEYHAEETKEKPFVVALQFEIEKEPWANPQMLKAQQIYSILGKIKVNKWPKDHDTLILTPVSTTDDSWFNLSLPTIGKEMLYQPLTGQIIFKYPQNSFDEPLSIKLMAYFKNEEDQKIYPRIIGYDQLIAKVVSKESLLPMDTGYENMSLVGHTILKKISKELPTLSTSELESFIPLLRGLLNFQGYCVQEGRYKKVNHLIENEFRDNIIAHLKAQPYLGEGITKEAEVSGGKVEISWKGSVVELKVERKISDRAALIKKYSQQPVAYASGNTRQLSILCILDLTLKKRPPAPPQNNVFLLTPELHGYEESQPDFPSRTVLIVIDGNLRNPSDYSR
jgi:hypothetical protein